MVHADQTDTEPHAAVIGRRPPPPPDQRRVGIQRTSVEGPQTIHLPDLVREILDETERLIRAGHMGALTGMAPAEVDQFVQQLHAEWLANIDPPTCLDGAP